MSIAQAILNDRMINELEWICMKEAMAKFEVLLRNFSGSTEEWRSVNLGVEHDLGLMTIY
jgi:hypothetical protein